MEPSDTAAVGRVMGVGDKGLGWKAAPSRGRTVELGAHVAVAVLSRVFA